MVGADLSPTEAERQEAGDNNGEGQRSKSPGEDFDALDEEGSNESGTLCEGVGALRILSNTESDDDIQFEEEQ